MAQGWSTLLTAQQRADWRSYAHQYPRTNRWGHPTLTNGYTRFIAVNHREARIDGDPTWLDAPTIPHPPPALPSFTAASGTGNVTVTVPPPNWSTIPTTAYQLRAYWGSIVPAGVNFYGSPWTYAGLTYQVPVAGWINDPWVLAYPGGLTQDDRLFVKFMIIETATGAFSNYVQGHADIT